MEKKKVALVLGGGGALGFAHIGVIKVLEKYHIPVDIVVGTSMGGLVGAAYAVGLSTKKMTEFACKFKSINFFDFNFNTSGIFSGKGVMKSINKFLPEVNIETLPKNFACVACDLIEEKELVIASGNIRDAVRATISMPGIFVPFQKDDMILVDGGVVNNLPEDVAMTMGADIIISCDVMEKCRVKSCPKNAINTLIYSINCSTKEIQKYKSCHSDILIQPDISGVTQLKFTSASTMKAIKAGEKETLKYIDEIIKLIKEK